MLFWKMKRWYEVWFMFDVDGGEHALWWMWMFCVDGGDTESKWMECLGDERVIAVGRDVICGGIGVLSELLKRYFWYWYTTWGSWL